MAGKVDLDKVAKGLKAKRKGPVTARAGYFGTLATERKSNRMIKTWRYNTIKTKVGDTFRFAIHEVYLDENGKPVSYTIEPVYPEAFKEWFALDKDQLEDNIKKCILSQLKDMFKDCKENPVLTKEDFAVPGEETNAE